MVEGDLTEVKSFKAVLEEQSEISPGFVTKEDDVFTFGNAFQKDFKTIENLPLEHFGIDQSEFESKLKKKEEERPKL